MLVGRVDRYQIYAQSIGLNPPWVRNESEMMMMVYIDMKWERDNFDYLGIAAMPMKHEGHTKVL